MKYCNKMTLVPYQEGGAGEEFVTAPSGATNTTSVASRPKAKSNSIRSYALQRQSKMLQVVLKLAVAGAYDSNGEMTTSDGKQVNVIPLILHCFTPGKTILGMDDFIQVMSEAGVDPELVINENVREMLLQHRTRSTPTVSRSNPTVSLSTPSSTTGVSFSTPRVSLSTPGVSRSTPGVSRSSIGVLPDIPGERGPVPEYGGISQSTPVSVVAAAAPPGRPRKRRTRTTGRQPVEPRRVLRSTKRGLEQQHGPSAKKRTLRNWDANDSDVDD